MTTITLPDDLEARVAEEAKRLGTTTEVLAIEELRKRFINPRSKVDFSSYANAAEFYSGYVGVVEGPGGDVAANSKRLYAESLEEKKRQGRL